MTFDDLLRAATLAAALGCGLNGGVFFAFSTFVMPALGRLPAPQGIAAMQSINVVAVTAPFMTLFFGTAVLCLGLAIRAVTAWDQPGAVYVLSGSVVYLAGIIGVTVACNVPRNDALARVDPAGADGARVWASYLVEWTRWNHVRTVAGLVAAALLTAGLRAI